MVSAKQLSPGERVIISTRTHWKALILPVLVLVVATALAIFLITVLPSGSAHNPLLIVIGVVWLIVVVWFFLRPFLIWASASYTVTNRRLITRSGVFTRSGRDIPLHRITDVRFERGVLDRMLGCGTLVMSDASTEGESTLPDVPHVEQLQLTLNNLLLHSDDGSDDDGTQPPHSQPAST